MTKQLVTGVAGYGSELVYHTPSDLRTLRSAACKAIGRSRAGNNPYLAMHVSEGLEDIALSLLIRKVMFWRRYFRSFPTIKSAFLQALVTGQHRNGATAFLRRTFLDHGLDLSSWWAHRAPSWLENELDDSKSTSRA